MTTDNIIAAIRAKQPELSEHQIQEMLKEERARSGGLLGDETILRLIAARCGVEVTKQVKLDGILSSSRLFAGLNNVSVEGRLVAVFPARSFSGERSGKIANLVIVDNDGMLRVVLWNDKAEVVERNELQVGQVVRFLHGYTKEDQYGKVELHLGVKGKVEISEDSQVSYPSVEKFALKISEISDTFNNVHLAGVVKEVFESKIFTKGDGTRGRFMRFTLGDDSAEIGVVVWNGKVDVLEKYLRPNVSLYLINGKVKEQEGGGFEIHVDSSSFVQVESAVLQQKIKLLDLKEGETVTVEGEVVGVEPVREVTTGKGEQIKLLSFELKDETGSVKVSAWRSYAEQLSNLKAEDRVVVENGFVKMGFGGKLELTTRSGTQFTIKKTTLTGFF